MQLFNNTEHKEIVEARKAHFEADTLADMIPKYIISFYIAVFVK